MERLIIFDLQECGSRPMNTIPPGHSSAKESEIQPAPGAADDFDQG
jgi:hypothetical protein